MSSRGRTSAEEAHLLLRKWHDEQTPLYVVLSEGVPATSLRLNMPGLVTELEPGLVICHARGSADGFLKCSWIDVEHFEYMEMREEAERLAAYPGAPDFMRNRSILAIHARQNVLIRLVDLSLPL